MKAFFIVTSPLQAICAAEAYHYYGITSCDVVAKFGGNQLANESLSKTLERYALTENILTISKKRSFRDLVSVLRKLRSNQYDLAFNAEFNGWFQNVLLANISWRKRVVYDDGVMTLHDYEKYFRPQLASQKKHVEKELLLRCLGYQNFRFETFTPLELFTMFDLESLPLVNVERNAFAMTSSKREGFLIDGNAPLGVLGQPLVEGGLVSFEYYEKCIRDLSDAQPLVYFAHRGETEELLAKWSELPNVRVVREDLPIEISIEKHKLCGIVGFISTALRTLHLLYPKIEVQYFRIPEQEFTTPKFQSVAASTYEQLSEDLSPYDPSFSRSNKAL